VVGDQAARIAETGASITVADDLPIVDADPTLLHQILGNLIDNGLAYNRRDVVPRVSVDCLKEADRVVLSVADNGLGIAPEYHEKIFNVFQRLHCDDAYPGTGIGLAIVKKSVEMLKGKVWLESKVGEGTTFFVQLPVG
jgi:light-regulated signal transduction histidine kinase (bacteriophytochrome)